MKSFITKTNIEKSGTILLIASMFLLPAVEFICSLFGKPFLLQEEIVVSMGGFSLICVLLLALKNQCIRLYKSDLFLGLLFLFAILSLIFSKDIMQSIYGNKPSYREGIFVFFSYYSVALLASRIINIDYRKWLLKSFLILGIVETFVGILQLNGLWPYSSLFDWTTPVGENAFGTPSFAFGFTEQINFFSALTVIFTGLTAGAFLLAEGKKRILYLGLSAFCFYGVLASYSRLGLLGVIGFLCYLLLISFVAYKIKVKKKALSPKSILLLFVIYVLVLLFASIVSPELMGKFARTQNELSKAASGNVNALGSSRIFIWKEGLETVPHCWYIGTGLDNYVYSFFWDNPEYTGFYQDKGHNEYIHILVTQGVFALITWLSMILYNLYTSTKRFFHSDNVESKLTFILIVMYGGYLCQALANSSVTNVAIYNWIITGLLLYTADKKPLKTIKIPT